jgi:hypothetical protein
MGLLFKCVRAKTIIILEKDENLDELSNRFKDYCLPFSKIRANACNEKRNEALIKFHSSDKSILLSSSYSKVFLHMNYTQDRCMLIFFVLALFDPEHC